MSQFHPTQMLEVTPADGVEVAFNGLYVGVAGDIAFTPVNNPTSIVVPVPSGWYYPGEVKEVLATGTTATSIFGLKG